jgi:multiple sugar transport system substrate-binding protein
MQLPRWLYLTLMMVLTAVLMAACSAPSTPDAGSTGGDGGEATEASGDATVVEFWTTDNEEDRVTRYEEVAAAYEADHPGVDVQIVPIEESSAPQRLSTAVAANNMPDIVRLSVDEVAAIAADGLLNEDAAEEVVNNVGRDDFRGGLLDMVTNQASGKVSAVPYDGWIQAIWYRTDAFEELGLEAPTTWDSISAACTALAGHGDLLYGITLGTDPGENYGHQIFEQVAISNNAWPFDEEGNVTFDTPEMAAALEFYTSLQACATPGPQYWRGAAEGYEFGQAGMLFYSTYIMDDLVEGSDFDDTGTKLELGVEDLANNTGFAPTMEGPNGSATYGQLTTLAITRDADPEAVDVATYFLKEGYQDILALAPFGKIPVLESAVEEWKGSTGLFANYPPETLESIAAGYESMQRWLFRPDYDATERAVVGDIESRLLIPQVLSNIAIEGNMTPEEGAAWLQEQVEALLAERQ